MKLCPRKTARLLQLFHRWGFQAVVKCHFELVLSVVGEGGEIEGPLNKPVPK